MSGDDDPGRRGVQGGTVARRRLLRAASAATIGAVSLTAGNVAVAAGDSRTCGGWPSPPQAFPTIDLTQERPDPLELDVDECCVYAHGWNGMDSSQQQTRALELALHEEGYRETMVTARWDANTRNFWDAERNADQAGVRLGRWLRAEYGEDSDVTIRLAGHSLGGRVLLNALKELAGDVVVDTASLLGAAVEDGSICADGRFADGIRDSAANVYGYHSRRDDTVCVLYALSTLESGIGCAGADCGSWFSTGATSEKYTDVDVTDTVPSHCEYFRHDRAVGCTDQMVDDFR
jgi:hypothetical protein